MISKLVIGTANFGLEYGVANKKRLEREEVFRILKLASDQGVWGIDTATDYGAAEDIIGEFFRVHGTTFKVIAKLPRKSYDNGRDVEQEVVDSLVRMNIPSVEKLIIHSFETYQRYGGIILPVLNALMRKGVIGQYGVSIYHPQEAIQIIEEAKVPLALEIPMNLFDQRFLKDDLLRKIKGKGHTILARSIFLQGLFFLSDAEIEHPFDRVRDKLVGLRNVSKKEKFRIEWLALDSIIGIPDVDLAVIGVDGSEQLMLNFEGLKEENFRRIRDRLIPPAFFEVDDEDILIPSRWPELMVY